jgi:hypothetical protein
VHSRTRRKADARNHIRPSAFDIWLRGLNPFPLSPLCRGHGSHHFFCRTLAMKIERFGGHPEAREALVLSVAGVTAIMLIANLVLMILY